jgi:hypothetical protein
MILLLARGGAELSHGSSRAPPVRCTPCTCTASPFYACGACGGIDELAERAVVLRSWLAAELLQQAILSSSIASYARSAAGASE